MTREKMEQLLRDNWDLVEEVINAHPEDRTAAEHELFASLMLVGILKAEDLSLFVEVMHDV